MTVRTTENEGSFLAQIELKHGEASTRRSVSDPTCATATTALAVIAALTVEPEPVKIVHTEPDLPPSPPPPSLPPPAWHLRVGGAFATTTFLAPTISFGALGFADLTREVSRFFALRARVGFMVATSLGIDVANASAVVTSYLARVELGGPRVSITRGFEANLALLADLGSLVGEGRAATSLTDASLWFDAGVIARLRLELARLAFEAGFGAAIPMHHTRFQFLPGPMVVYESPPIGAIAELGLELRLF